jgi:CRISPR/Cas system CMR-associated protein Cmr3 (group 5 of RAMP superfamily)
MTTPYLVTFTPVGRFFFGGPVTFNDGFLVRSDRFPQPTTVLGALRAALLVGDGLLVQHKRGRFVPKEQKEAAARLTGTARVNAFEESPQFGVIDRLTAPFLYRTAESGRSREAFFILPADVAHSPEKGLRVVDYTPLPATASNCGRRREAVYQSGFDPKTDSRSGRLGGRDAWQTYLAGQALQGETIDVDGVGDDNPFLVRRQVGIGLERRRVAEGQFYVKREYAFRRGFAFGTVVWLKDPSAASTFAKTITLGGDQSVFSLDIAPIKPEDPFFADHPILRWLLTGEPEAEIRNAEPVKAVAVSPLVLKAEDGLFNEAVHSVVSRIDNVRMLQSISVPKTGVSGGGAQFRDGKKVLKSDAYRVVPAGSVFFLGKGPEKDTAEAVNTVQSELPKAIGYNRILYCPSQVTPQ